MMNIAQTTEVRAALALGTVKKRIRMCGRPAVPSTSARPSERVSSGFGGEGPGAGRDGVERLRQVGAGREREGRVRTLARVRAIEQLDRVEPDLAEHEHRHHE